ncbi:uncharacterized protein KQ657_001132 [Scheffersomyces spartinae]|uniref:Major facilitator superfamily (MFS) profile domain-containing protein n=1 Tax=Scheffersomyces spartinae TaxID=45513 RepID=A0A9P8AHY6_9ASCO|nr:uncharacterized protein KQ657_001132 [Scheffersomyces spartinae]KAG7193018.1 hypothetical protein KQ657_001132 [Scheffersomyces spartinae]
MSDTTEKPSIDLERKGEQTSNGSVDASSVSRNSGVLEEAPQTFTGAGDGVPEEDLRSFNELARLESTTSGAEALSRRLTGADELLRRAETSDEPLPKMGMGKPYPEPLPSRESYQVNFDGPDDPANPVNWSLKKKSLMTYCLVISALCVAIGSAFFSAVTPVLQEKFHIGRTTATLSTSLYVFGFASGPIVWGPLSELYGRKAILLASMFGYSCFCFATATSKDLQSIMITRFFTGFIGAAPLAVCPAVMADLYSAASRGVAISFFAICLFGGPLLAPIFSAFIVKNQHMGWRWCAYIMGIMGCVATVSVAFVLEETHRPLILVRKAEILRRRTKNWGIYAPHEEVSLSLKEIAEKNITRPIKMLGLEPILFLVSLYNAFVYGMLYLFLTAIPLIFLGEYHWIAGVSELPYIAMFLGTIAGGLICVFFEKRFGRIMQEKGRPIPEERLPAMMVGSVFFAIGMFWLGWSGAFGDKVHWIVPCIGAFIIGMALILTFLPCLNYIVDCYLLYAASALAGNTFLRSSFGAVFPLFAYQMFVNMKIQYASTLLGSLAAIAIPVPFLFYKYGAKIRARSKYAIDDNFVLPF